MNNTRIEGIDYLRAACSVFVVVWHMKAAGQSLIFSQEMLPKHTFTISDFLNFHILLLAVPVFIFISTFLYAIKGPDNKGLIARLKRIMILLIFWPIALTVFNNGAAGIRNILPVSIYSFAYILLRGGCTPYYFFVSLMICLFITHLAFQMKRIYQVSGLLLSAVLLSILPGITKHTGIHFLSIYWCPFNFVPFSFAAVLVAQNLDFINANRMKLLTGSLILCVVFALFEWKFSVDAMFLDIEGGIAIPAYTRTSLVFGVLTLAVPALNLRIRSNEIVKYMSRYSLSLYLIHPFVMSTAKGIAARISHDSFVRNFVSVLVVVLSSYVLAMILKNFLKEKVLF